MRYQTPELLLVGAAHNLVLEGIGDSVYPNPDCRFDSEAGQVDVSDLAELW